MTRGPWDPGSILLWLDSVVTLVLALDCWPWGMFVLPLPFLSISTEYLRSNGSRWIALAFVYSVLCFSVTRSSPWTAIFLHDSISSPGCVWRRQSSFPVHGVLHRPGHASAVVSGWAHRWDRWVSRDLCGEKHDSQLLLDCKVQCPWVCCPLGVAVLNWKLINHLLIRFWKKRLNIKEKHLKSKSFSLKF